MKKRNQALVVVFTILTCGIYYLYWLFVVTRDIESVSEPQGGPCSSAGTAVVLSIVTCGIYDLYWFYESGVRAAKALGRNNSESGLCYMLLTLFGLGIIAQVLLQSDVNAIVDKCERIVPLTVESTAAPTPRSADPLGSIPSDRPQKERPVDSNENSGFNY